MPLVQIELDYFDKRMALDVIEDTLTALGSMEGRGFALGFCGGFYMYGLLTHAEWEAYLARIPKSSSRSAPHSQRVERYAGGELANPSFFGGMVMLGFVPHHQPTVRSSPLPTVRDSPPAVYHAWTGRSG